MNTHQYKPVRILLINAINPYIEVERRYPGLGLAYIASSMRKNLPDVKIDFCIADKDIYSVAKKFCPDLVGISSVSQNFNIAKQYAEYFSVENIPVIMGGIHITALPEQLPVTALAACLGEGELSFVDIMKLYLEENITPDTLSNVLGIAFWNKGVVQITGERPQISELDALPMPARDLLSIRKHTYMFTSRGCPFRCTFCSSSRFWRSLRFFSAEYVVDEIEFLIRKYKVNLISFFDDLFAADKSRVEKIVRLLEQRNILGKVKFTCSCRVSIIDEELAKMFSRMGVVSVGIGLESGDEETLRYLKRDNIGIAQNYSAIDILKKYRIFVNGSFIIGSPRETREQIMCTYNFIRGTKLDLFDIYFLTPYPGTPVWEYAKGRGLVSDNMPDWSRLSVNIYHSPDKAIVLSEVIKGEELTALYKKFIRLRFWRNISKITNHPLRKDLPWMALNLLREYVRKLFKNESR